MNKTTASILGLVAVIVLFVSVNVVSGALLRGARVDLTEDKLFTLDQGTHNILGELETPIVLRYYFSAGLVDELAKSAPGLRDYSRRVRELLEEYEARSGGRIELRVLDPEPFSEEEDRAVAAGLQGFPANAAGERFYLGLVASNDIGEEEVIAFLNPTREEFLEYDLTKIVHQLSVGNRPRIGLISSLPIGGAPANPMQPQQQPTPPWYFVESLSQLFEVEMVQTSATTLPPNLDVLLLVHPRGLAPALQFSIDQFVLKGGRVVAFLDPHCEAQAVQQDPNNPLSGAMADRSSELGPLLAAWGVAMDKEKIVGDRPNSRRVRNPQTGAPIEYVVYLDIDGELMSEGDPITAELETLYMFTAGALTPLPGAKTTFTPIIETGEEAALVERMSIAFGPDPERLLQSYVPSGTRYTLAARVSGLIDTAFPDGPPGADDEIARAEMLTSSQGPVNLLLVSDADLLSDHWWVDIMNLGRQRIAMPKANNGDLVVNAIENLSGSADLISLRSRRSYLRPFDRIAELRRQAEDRHRAEEQRLQARLQEAEKAINDLQAQKEGSVSAAILTPEQRAEIEKFKADQADTRKELRNVQRQLRSDIDDLTLRMKLLNVLGIPSLVAVAGLLALAYRHLRRS